MKRPRQTPSKRYGFATDDVVRLCVLDIARGVGCGTDLLGGKSTNHKSTGVESSLTSIEYAIAVTSAFPLSARTL